VQSSVSDPVRIESLAMPPATYVDSYSQLSLTCKGTDTAPQRVAAKHWRLAAPCTARRDIIVSVSREIDTGQILEHPSQDKKEEEKHDFYSLPSQCRWVENKG